MSCLTDYIGLNGCSDTIPESGLYIDSLPGISIKSMDSIATSEQITYKQVWADVQDEAYILFKDDFFASLLNCYKVNKHCDYEALICDNKAVLKTAWKYLLAAGLMRARRYSDRLNYFTTIGLEDAEQLITDYGKQYKSSLAAAILQVDISRCKLECGGNPEYVTCLP